MGDKGYFTEQDAYHIFRDVFLRRRDYGGADPFEGISLQRHVGALRNGFLTNKLYRKELEKISLFEDPTALRPPPPRPKSPGSRSSSPPAAAPTPTTPPTLPLPTRSGDGRRRQRHHPGDEPLDFSSLPELEDKGSDIDEEKDQGCLSPSGHRDSSATNTTRASTSESDNSPTAPNADRSPPTLPSPVKTQEAARSADRKTSSRSPNTDAVVREMENTYENTYILKWEQGSPKRVEVAGSFTEPPWVRRMPLAYCPRTSTYWISLQEAVPELRPGSYQFKYVVDGEWKCDMSLPTQDDGNGHINNLLVCPTFMRKRSSRRFKRYATEEGAGPRQEDSSTHTCPEAARGIGLRPADLPGINTPQHEDRQQEGQSSASASGAAAADDEGPSETDLDIEPLQLQGKGWARRRASVGTPNAGGAASSSGTAGGLRRTSGGLRRWSAVATTDALGLRGSLAPPSPLNALTRSRANTYDNAIEHQQQQHAQNRDDELFPGGDADKAAITRCPSAYQPSNLSLREDRLRRVASLSLNHQWPESVTGHLHPPEVLIDLHMPDARLSTKLRLIAGAFMIPHPEKVETGGADAYFICEIAGGGAVGVADGVGEWDSFGLNPKMFADELMLGCQHAAILALTDGDRPTSTPTSAAAAAAGSASASSSAASAASGAAAQEKDSSGSPTCSLTPLSSASTASSKTHRPAPSNGNGGSNGDSGNTGTMDEGAAGDGAEGSGGSGGVIGSAGGAGGGSEIVVVEEGETYLEEIKRMDLPPEEIALRMLQYGYTCTRSYGSSTALVAHLDKKGEKLGVANLGDSSMILLRRQKVYSMTVVERTKEQQHSWNCPYQLSRLPDESRYEELEREGKETLVSVCKNARQRRDGVIPEDKPEMAQLYSVNVREGDLLILGTDGVFDNLFDYEICNIANLALSPYESLVLHEKSLVTPARNVAIAIAEAARHKSKDPLSRSPFAKSARQNHTHYMGGKLDDITVIAAWVIR
ncbi:unnamed protein product [Vitrella brassicaformis CCMP3155]|uniref:PPM-type phosphatase domain-containing protein n=2 Tax=Vitrella brassicaformis TaxID=1169539 RepID=A0A0G4FYZ0_VITBC|nr:unnamed protein product [Vitrella brassicaformis CCMP3155]|mmetsp:Transcript_24876/g.61506  ORF Transcript_24876/g.61506 Transcript_24876/m.61506 type:complete len:989 (+) Transcript_24876:107-3073(+)|eukprot:CEM20443.1 unnamed protein product [Vitrella brassicaformis CCMP3155]